MWSILGAGGELRYSALLAAEEALFYRCCPEAQGGVLYVHVCPGRSVRE